MRNNIVFILALHFSVSSGWTAEIPALTQSPPAVQAKLLAVASSSASAGSSLISNTKKALAIYAEGRLPDAVALQHQTVLGLKSASVDKKDEAAARAGLSYLSWQQGNVLLALQEGEAAGKLSPNNETYLLNLALMKEALSDYEGAVEVYRQMLSLDSSQLKASLNAARCFFKSEKRAEAVKFLQHVYLADNFSFPSLLAVSDLALQASETSLVIEVAGKALKIASDEKQKNEARSHLLLALLRENKIEEATHYMACLFDPSLPCDYELYVRALELLAPATNPELGKKILSVALSNCTANSEAEGLYRLGRICQGKAVFVGYDKEKHQVWTNMAIASYKEAVKRDPLQARYHLALAGTLERAGMPVQMFDEVKAAASLDQSDSLAGYYLKSLGFKTEECAEPVSNLEMLSFKIDGLNCGCHVGKLEMVFSKIDGVVFVSLSRVEPLTGVLFVDKSVANADDVLAKCMSQFNADPLQIQAKSPAKVAFNLVKREDIKHADEAIRIAQNVKNGSVLQFFNQFKAQEPVMPI